MIIILAPTPTDEEALDDLGRNADLYFIQPSLIFNKK